MSDEAAGKRARGGEEANGPLSDADVRRYLRLAVSGLLALLARVVTSQLYTDASAAVARWVATDYVSVFQAAFNLVVLLLALAGLAVFARRRWLLLYESRRARA